MLYVFTGEGKGKTTAAIGQGVRMVGQGKRVLMIQFIKSKKWPTGEEKALRCFKKRFQVIKEGKGFVGILGDRLPKKVHKEAARGALEKAKKAIRKGNFDLVILDEINVALSLRLITLKQVLELIKMTPPEIDLIFTGRGAPRKIIEKADLVTEFKEIKHPFQKGILGEKGREY